MRQLVTLNLGVGNCKGCFPATLQIGKDGKPPSHQISGKLPSVSKLLQDVQNWHSAISSCLFFGKRMQAAPVQAHNVSIPELSETLTASVNSWLNSKPFRPLKEELLSRLNPDDEIRFLIQTSNTLLWRIPWHLWDFFDRHPRSEIAFCPLNYQQISSPPNATKSQIHILAILGDSTGIDLKQDRTLLDRLPHAKTHFLVEPKPQELNDYLCDRPCNILYFGGHSRTEGERGEIRLNKTDRPTIGEFKPALKKAIARGLKLAIFNSCDGLGLARELADLHLPQTIIMRSPVPDKIAQEFLKHFLTAFSSGKSLYLSVREAREKLQSLESQFHCASWHPAICQNPAATPPTWSQLM